MIDSFHKMFFINSEKSAAQKYVFSRGRVMKIHPTSGNKGLKLTMISYCPITLYQYKKIVIHSLAWSAGFLTSEGGINTKKFLGGRERRLITSRQHVWFHKLPIGEIKESLYIF